MHLRMHHGLHAHTWATLATGSAYLAICWEPSNEEPLLEIDGIVGDVDLVLTRCFDASQAST